MCTLYVFMQNKGDFRRKWDKDEYEELAQKRLTEEREKKDGECQASYAFPLQCYSFTYIYDHPAFWKVSLCGKKNLNTRRDDGLLRAEDKMATITQCSPSWEIFALLVKRQI